MNQYDIKRCVYDQSELDSESSDSNESLSSSEHYRRSPRYHPPRSHLPRSLQLAVMQVDAAGEQVADRATPTNHQLPAMTEWRVGWCFGNGWRTRYPKLLRRKQCWRRLPASGWRRMTDLFTIFLPLRENGLKRGAIHVVAIDDI